MSKNSKNESSSGSAPARLEKIEANGGVIQSDPDAGTVKYRAPDGTIAEIADADRYEKMKRGPE